MVSSLGLFGTKVFENFKLAAGGIFNNTAGTYSVSLYFSNNNTGGTDGQATISGGTLAVTGVYTNDNGTTTNTATIQVASDITNVAGTFTTSAGTIEYNGAGTHSDAFSRVGSSGRPTFARIVLKLPSSVAQSLGCLCRTATVLPTNCA